MMMSLGHSVYLYSGEQNEAQCTEHIPCITEQERIECLGGKHYTQASFDYTLPHWVKFNGQVIEGIKQRIQPKDFICVIGGLAHKQVADAFPDNMTVEFGIGYSGTFAKYRVFESYAWMHTVYGAQQGAQGARGFWFDEVIPSYFDMKDFKKWTRRKEDYYLFVGRMVEDKGYTIAQEVCRKMGKRLILAGPAPEGWEPEYGEYVGEIGPKKRASLMTRAQAVFTPSLYIEPFGSVAAEAQLCGTPVICTDWGAYTETVIEEVTGFHCRTFRQFFDAVEKVKELDYKAIRESAIERFSMDYVALMYNEYFKRLLTLWGSGWYEL